VPEVAGSLVVSESAAPIREEDMTFLQRLFRWRRKSPVQRIRICIECGMPVAEHKTWCSILRRMQENPVLASSDK